MIFVRLSDAHTLQSPSLWVVIRRLVQVQDKLTFLNSCQDKTRQNLLFRTLAGAALSEAFSEGIVVNLELGDLQQGYRVSKNILSL